MSLIQEIDFGTPRSKSETMVTLTIDGQSVTVFSDLERGVPKSISWISDMASSFSYFYSAA